MRIDKLKVTQCGLRNKPQIDQMIELIKSDGRFNKETLASYVKLNPNIYHSPLIKIVEFPDKELAIGDGHHRILAIKMGGRDFLHDDEYEIIQWSYQEYLEINFDQKWVTPFDPRTHNRLPNFLKFKLAVKERRKISDQSANDYIKSNLDQYAKEKKYEDIISLGEDAGFSLDGFESNHVL